MCACVFLFTNRFSIIRDDMLSIEFRISSSRFSRCLPFDLTRQQDCLWYGFCYSIQAREKIPTAYVFSARISYSLREGGRFCVYKL